MVEPIITNIIAIVFSSEKHTPSEKQKLGTAMFL